MMVEAGLLTEFLKNWLTSVFALSRVLYDKYFSFR